MTARLLVVEDDTDLRSALRRGLQDEGHAVTVAVDGAGAIAASAEPFDAIVLDVGLPDADGRDVLQALRARGIQTPVIFLTARDAVSDRLAGFSAGADDYLTKPFAFAELLARLQVLLRRSGFDGAQTFGGLRLDPVTHALVGEHDSVDLTPTEFRLLATLVAAPDGAAVRRAELVRSGWPEGAIVHDNTLDVYIARLRRKLRTLDGLPSIDTVHGIGYRIA